MTAMTGIFSAQQQDLADLIALSPAFIAECATSDNPDPLAHIAIIADVKDGTPRPRAIVCDAKDINIDEMGYANGSTVIIFERDVEEEFRKTEDSAEGPDVREMFARFNNWTGQVMLEVVLTARNGGHLMIERVQRVQFPWRSDLDEVDKEDSRLDYLVCKINVVWGPKK